MTRVELIVLASLALPAIARAQANCDELREAERTARQRLHDCTRRGGGCAEEFRARDETVAAAADCPASTPTPTPEPTPPAESIPTPAATMTPPPQPPPASTPSPTAFPVTLPAKSERRSDHGHRVSMTVSLIGLLVDPTLVEITGEYALSRKLGVALTGGYANGTDTVEYEETGASEEIHLRIIEAGGSARYYLVGSYDHGMQVGAQTRYAQLDAKDIDIGAATKGSASIVSAGPFIGYKKTARFGLTFDSQLGVRYSASRTKLRDDSGNSVRYGDDGFGLLLNLNLGWAF